LQNARLGGHAVWLATQTDFKQLMNLPFSRDAFFAVFATYNDAVWPMPLLWLALGMAAAALTRTPQAFTGRAVAAVLAALWAWMGGVYHLQYFSQISPAAWWFGAVFVLAAMAFAWFGVWHNGLRFDAASAGGGMPPRVRATAGWGLVIIALFVYPMIGVALGHRFRRRRPSARPARAPSTRSACLCWPARTCRACCSWCRCCGRWPARSQASRSASRRTWCCWSPRRSRCW
jgi:hypothetical protein